MEVKSVSVEEIVGRRRTRGPHYGVWNQAAGEPNNETLTLALKGVVKAAIELLPHPAAFFSVFQGETAERRIQIVNNEETAVTVKGVQAGSTHFTAEVKPVQAGRTYELIVRVPSGVPPGRYRESATVLTDHADRPRGNGQIESALVGAI